MNYIFLGALLLIAHAYTYSSVATLSSQSKTAVDSSLAELTEQAQEFKEMTNSLSASEKKILAKIIKKIINKDSIEKETASALALARGSKDALANVANAIMIITDVNARIKDNNFRPLLDLYEIVKPGYSKKLEEELSATDKKLKAEDSPAHFIRRFAQLDAYQILGVQKEGLSDRQVKEAFNKLSLELHPDKNLNNPDSAKAAFNLLKDARDKLLATLTPSISPAPSPSPEPEQ